MTTLPPNMKGDPPKPTDSKISPNNLNGNIHKPATMKMPPPPGQGKGNPEKPPSSFTSTLARGRSRSSPLAIAATLLIGGTAVTYYTLYRYQRQYRNTPLYRDALQHLGQYQPAADYIGIKWKVGWVKEAKVTDNNVKLVVPVRGDRGKAHLHIHGVKGKDNQPELDSLDIEVFKPPKSWTFYDRRHGDVSDKEKASRKS